MPYFGPGIYEHYKGGHYRAVGLGQHESTGAKFVIYHSYSVEHDLKRFVEGVDFVIRPLNLIDGEDAWNDLVEGPEVEIGGPELVPRFRKLKSV
jgi:hypothetical protein